MEFYTWDSLYTFSGAMFVVAVFTQITKSIPGISKIPTQVWSYILALIVLICARLFGEGLDVGSACLSCINAALVSLASNGGYEALERLRTGIKNTSD